MPEAPAIADPPELPKSANERARAMIRRRALVECLLFEVLGVEWWKVHKEAMRFDAAISDDVEDRIARVLGDPGVCPHGNPIPGSANTPDQSGAVRLSDAPVGAIEVVRIGAILEHDDEALQLLHECGFLPGRDAEIKQRRDGWIEIAGAIRDAAVPPHIGAHTFVFVRE
ncbi:MAG: metal-dependent transcriptional regulator [Nitriliruptoraceae bacterium]